VLVAMNNTLCVPDFIKVWNSE